MPQTREHALVLHALGIAAGVVVVTKCDLADPELALLEASELLPGAELVAVSARTGMGLDTLRHTLDRVVAGLHSRADLAGPARLHIDRVFTIRGAGTVVTGTLWSGSIGRGDQLLVLPDALHARVRAVQVHDQPLERAAAGQRVAVNLVGVATDQVQRGDVLVAPDAGVRPSYLIDARLEFQARELQHGDRVHVHHGTRETPARTAWLGGPFWQLRLEQPLMPLAGDRLVIRQIAPPDTLGGGEVLDPNPRKHGPSRDVLLRLERLARGEPAGDQVPANATTDAPIKKVPTGPLPPSAQALEQRLKEAGFEPPLDSEFDPADLTALREAGRAVRVGRNLHYHADALGEIRSRLIALAEAGGGSITLARLRDELGTSRKFAQALLEHFDSEKLTIRRGDEHFVRRSAQVPR
jgi:selenocysteine-specific elongation factor